jgi:hypothetical protein
VIPLTATIAELLMATDWATKTTAICSIAVAAAAGLALGSLDDARKMRHGQIVADLSRRWDDERVLESQKLFREWNSEGAIKLIDALWADESTNPNPQDLKQWYLLEVYPNVIETIGVFVSEGIISEDVVLKLWGPPIMNAWKEWREPTLHLRAVTKSPEDWRYFEALGLRMSALVADARTRVEVTRLP